MWYMGSSLNPSAILKQTKLRPMLTLCCAAADHSFWWVNWLVRLGGGLPPWLVGGSCGVVAIVLLHK